MALKATQVVGGGPPGAITPTYAAALAGDTFTAGPDVFLHFKKGSGSPVTVTATVPGSPGLGIDETSDPVTVGASSETLWGPFPSSLFGGTVSLTYSDTTTLTMAVLKFVSA